MQQQKKVTLGLKNWKKDKMPSHLNVTFDLVS
jgi:hypothetical protein